MKEIEKNTNKWEAIHAHGLEALILLKYPELPKYYRFSAIKIKSTMAFFIEIEQSYLQYLYGNIKDPEQLKWFLRKKNKAKKKKKEEEQSSRHHTSWFQTILQS